MRPLKLITYWPYMQGLYTCLSCGHLGRIRGGIEVTSVCKKCKCDMIVPEKDWKVLGAHN
jgi:hypothetical protein